MATLSGWMVLDEAQEFMGAGWSNLINREFWDLLYTEEREWDE